MLNIGVIGFGYWGPNLVRNFAHHPKCAIKMISDKSEARLAIARKMYPFIQTTTDMNRILDDPGIQGVVIATPINTHYHIAKEALSRGKHVLVEKPLTNSRAHALELIKIARKKNLRLMVDHIYLYNGATRKIKEIISKGEIGRIQYFDSIRVNLGLIQNDSNVLWDLAVHDLSILNFLVAEKPSSLIATGVSHTLNNIENIAYITLNYKSGMITHINCSWISPVKIRMILIGGTKKMIVYNDVEPTEKVKVYDTNYQIVEKEKTLVDYRIGDIYIPKFDQTEALKNAADDFIGSIIEGREPFSNGKSAYDIIDILEAAQESIKKNGKEVFLDGNSEYREPKAAGKERKARKRRSPA